MMTICPRCQRRYNDAERWTICPHRSLHESPGEGPSASEAAAPLPEVARIVVANIQPGDVIVIESDQTLSIAQTEGLRGQLLSCFPQNKVLFLHGGVRMAVVAAKPPPPPPPPPAPPLDGYDEKVR